MANQNLEEYSQDELMAALFANLVLQNTNMAMIFLGQTPHPETGKKEIDLEHARYFIDQLEMLQVKTKGNLNRQEDALLKQSLTNLRMAFVDASNKEASEAPKPAEPTPELASKEASEESKPAEESHKRFSKKY